MESIERFAVVNINNVITRYVTGKEDLHNLKEGEYHRAVHVFVEVYGGRFLMQLKAPGTENEGKWSSSVSGHVRAGESFEKAAIRETEEELGLVINSSDLERIALINPCGETGDEFVTLYTYLMDDDTELLKINKDEVTEVLIWKLDDMVRDVDENKALYSPAFIILLNIFLELYKV